jgi:hypothetical protein
VLCSRYASRASVGIAREVLAALLVHGWLVLGLRPAVENGERGDSTEACILPKVGSSSVRHDDGDSPNAKEATSVQVLIGVDPHKAANVVAAIDEQGELAGSRSSPLPAKDCGPCSGGQSASRSGAVRLRAQAAWGAPWRRSS